MVVNVPTKLADYPALSVELGNQLQQNMTSVGCNLINETVKKKKYRKR